MKSPITIPLKPKFGNEEHINIRDQLENEARREGLYLVLEKRQWAIICNERQKNSK